MKETFFFRTPDTSRRLQDLLINAPLIRPLTLPIILIPLNKLINCIPEFTINKKLQHFFTISNSMAAQALGACLQT